MGIISQLITGNIKGAFMSAINLPFTMFKQMTKEIMEEIINGDKALKRAKKEKERRDKLKQELGLGDGEGLPKDENGNEIRATNDKGFLDFFETGARAGLNAEKPI